MGSSISNRSSCRLNEIIGHTNLRKIFMVKLYWTFLALNCIQEIVSIVGTNGSGKSTFIKILVSGLMLLDAGDNIFGKNTLERYSYQCQACTRKR